MIKLASEHKSVEESKTVERRIEQGESKANRPVILVADDNQDMLSFVVHGGRIITSFGCKRWIGSIGSAG